MAPHIPFLNSTEGIPIFRDFYSDAECVRVTLDRLPKLLPQFTKLPHLWIDSAFEGFHHSPADRISDWSQFISTFKGGAKFDEALFLQKPDKVTVQEFVGQLLDACLKYKPQRITIPQFPYDKENTKAKINRALAEAAGQWRARRTFSGSLILP